MPGTNPAKRPFSATIPDNVLRHFRVAEARYGAQSFKSPWSLRFPKRDDFCLYFVTGKDAYFECPDEFAEPVKCSDRTLVIIAGGQAHGWRDSLLTPFPTKTDTNPIAQMLPLASPARTHETVLSAISIPRRVFINFLRTGPAMVIGPAHRDIIDQVHDLLELMNDEVVCNTDDPVAEKISACLTEILLFYITQYWLREVGQKKASARPARNASDQTALRRVIDAVHERPEHDWSLSEMAAEAGMGRTSFCVRFKQEMKIAPMEYLTGVRMSLAAAHMRNPDLALAEIAWRVGYHSQAAFNRAFTRQYALTPGRYRRQFCSFR
jgi:AraC-like DNA-binding protein